jgi:hypothetical protein
VAAKARRSAAAQGIPEVLGRFGFFARGVVYLFVGGIAARVALLARGHAEGPGGALQELLGGWHGRAALQVVAAGLVSLVVYRLAQVVRARSAIARLVSLVGAIGALALVWTSVRILLNVRRGGTPGFREWGARLMANPWGRGALALGGAIAVVAGLVEVARAVLGALPKDFVAAVIARGNKKWASRLARVGLLAHGAVVALVGFSVFRAAVLTNPREIVGTAGALRRLTLLEGGPALFAVAAAGLLAYGLSMLVLAAHKRRRLR